MQTDRLPLHQDRIERLDAEPMECGGTVQKYGVLLDDLIEDVPDFRFLILDQALGALDGGRRASLFQLVEDERFEELQGHLFRQPALMEPQLRAHDDDRPAGVVDALAKQVLPEPPLFALQHIAERLQRALVGAPDRAPATPVVEQGIHRLLQHPHLVADDHTRRFQLYQAFEPIVAVDDPAVEIVEVRRGEPAPVERDQWPQFRRQHRDDIHDHPFRLVAGPDEGVNDPQAFDVFLLLRERVGRLHLVVQDGPLGFQIDLSQQLPDGLGPDPGLKA